MPTTCHASHHVQTPPVGAGLAAALLLSAAGVSAIRRHPAARDGTLA
jgi:hypothetical protein